MFSVLRVYHLLTHHFFLCIIEYLSCDLQKNHLFSIGLVLLFIHSNVDFHVILLNMKRYIFSAVNILIYLTYLSLLFISHRFLFVTYLHLFLRSLVSSHLSEDVTRFSKNASWFSCRRPFSEKCSSSGLLLCNHFLCFQ